MSRTLGSADLVDCRNFVNEILASRRRIVRVRGSELVLAIESASVDVRIAEREDTALCEHQWICPKVTSDRSWIESDRISPGWRAGGSWGRVSSSAVDVHDSGIVVAANPAADPVDGLLARGPHLFHRGAGHVAWMGTIGVRCMFGTEGRGRDPRLITVWHDARPRLGTRSWPSAGPDQRRELRRLHQSTSRLERSGRQDDRGSVAGSDTEEIKRAWWR